MTKARVTPSNKECRAGAQLALENADRHLCCASHLSKIREYGAAQAHLVLSVEEAIKAYFLYLKGIGLPIRQKILTRMLSQHQARLDFGVASHAVFHILKWMVDSIMQAVRDSEGYPESEVNEFIRNTYKKIALELEDAAKSPDDSGEINQRVLPVIKWWETADKLKQIGFYVDYHQGKWISPSSINKKTYSQSFEVAHEIIDITRRYFAAFESLSKNQQSELIKKTKKHYRNQILLKRNH